MDTAIFEIAAQYGVTGGLLLLVLWWLAGRYLPQQQKEHRAELERIIEAGRHSTNRLVEAVDRNSRIVQFNSQAMLVQSFINGGLEKEEAEQIVRRIQVSTLHWPACCDACGSDQRGAA